MALTPAEWVGSIGVALLLAAFVLNLRGVVRRDGIPYAAINAVGGGMACWASWMIGFFPFVILEGTWCLVAVVGLVRALVRLGRAPNGDPGSGGLSGDPVNDIGSDLGSELGEGGWVRGPLA